MTHTSVPSVLACWSLDIFLSYLKGIVTYCFLETKYVEKVVLQNAGLSFSVWVALMKAVP